MTDRDAFIEQLKRDPTNDLLHNVYADWLEEHGEEEEAKRQRQWSQAWEWLVEFCKSKDFCDHWEAGYEGSGRVEVYGAVDPAKLIAEIVEDNAFYHSGSTQFQETKYERPDLMREFWERFEIVTGKTVSQDERDDFSVRCGC